MQGLRRRSIISRLRQMTIMTELPLFDEYPAYVDNISESGTQHSGAGLLEVYYSPRRYATETVFALVAVAANVLVLVAMKRAYDIPAVGQHRTSSAYSLLFVNLSIANSLSCILSWLSNNTLFMFDLQLIGVLNTEPCLFFAKAVFASVFVESFRVVVNVIAGMRKQRKDTCKNRKGKRNNLSSHFGFCYHHRRRRGHHHQTTKQGKEKCMNRNARSSRRRRALSVLHLPDGGAVRVNRVWNSQHTDTARLLRGPVLHPDDATYTRRHSKVVR